MFSHIFVGSNDLDKTKQFYDALFATLGGNPGFIDAKGRLIYMHAGSMFMATKPIDGQPACPANGGTIGFAMSGPEQADAWHAAGVAAGAPPAKTRRGCARPITAGSTWPICATPMATSFAGFMRCPLKADSASCAGAFRRRQTASLHQEFDDEPALHPGRH